METIRFDLAIDQVPYLVKAVPFDFNNETRFRVTYNDSPEFIFAWDAEASQYMAIDHDAADLPDTLETVIARKLQTVAV